MKITWHGHACFSVESGGYTVVLDPHTGVPGYPPLSLSAQEVLCSHAHGDHSFRAGVRLTPPIAPSPFTVETLPTFHDERRGALRGGNTVHILRAEGLCVVHLGDLGHRLEEEQAAHLRGCDVLLLPVGGYYTIDAGAAYDTVRQLRPAVAVPMHYRHAPFGLENVAGVEPFLRRFAPDELHTLPGNAFDPARAPRGVVVLRYGTEKYPPARTIKGQHTREERRHGRTAVA